MEQKLDVRELAPPEPLEAILGALDDMPADDWLRVRLSREPFPLYAMLRDMEYSWRGHWTDSGFELLIRRKVTAPFNGEKAGQW